MFNNNNIFHQAQDSAPSVSNFANVANFVKVNFNSACRFIFKLGFCVSLMAGTYVILERSIIKERNES